MECKNAIFVMTSNLASEQIAEHGMDLRNAAKKAVETKLSANIGKFKSYFMMKLNYVLALNVTL